MMAALLICYFIVAIFYRSPDVYALIDIMLIGYTTTYNIIATLFDVLHAKATLIVKSCINARLCADISA